MFFQKDIETMKRADLEAMQLERLRRMVDYCYNNVLFDYRTVGLSLSYRNHPFQNGNVYVKEEFQN